MNKYNCIIIGFITLIRLRSDTPEGVSDKANKKIKNTSIRLGMYPYFILQIIK